MKIAGITILSILMAATALAAAEVTFECKITGSGESGFDILAINPGSEPRKCSATCTVTRKDGSTKSWSYTATVSGRGASQRIWFAGQAGVPGAPLSNPKISDVSCKGS